jgi:hypothetical protein
MSISRRSFLKGSAATAAISMVGGSALNILGAETATTALAKGPGNKWEGRVVVNFNKNATDGATANESVIKQMVNDAILLLSDQTTIGEAWKAIFPSTLTAQSKIAIKINILNNSNPAPHPFSVMAITEGLQQMDFNGTKFPATNITIYDMNNSSSMSSAGYTAARFPNIKLVKDSMGSGYTDGAIDSTITSASREQYATTLHNSDFLINVFSPRGHQPYAEKFSLGFKSHYGTYSAKYHVADQTSRFLRDINCTGPVFNKTVLSVCSGIFGLWEGTGPTGDAQDYSTYSKSMDTTSTNANPTTIIMSTDPVSCDMQAIKMMRINKALAYATTNLPKYLRASGGITGALTDTIYNIGIIEESAMDVRKIINGTAVTAVKNTHLQTNDSHTKISASQLRGQNITFIEYVVPSSYVNQKATVEILSLNGTKINEFQNSIQGVANHFSWDEKDKIGRQVSAGMYVVKLQSGSLSTLTQLSIVR